MVGPNGAGKTTLLNLLIGLGGVPSAGELTVLGAPAGLAVPAGGAGGEGGPGQQRDWQHREGEEEDDSSCDRQGDAVAKGQALREVLLDQQLWHPVGAVSTDLHMRARRW